MLEAFLFAVALAVGLTPEFLPMVVSVTFARGAVRLAAHCVIAKRLASIQDLGAMDVLCTDKTGTLIEARIRLARCADAGGRDSPRVLMLAHLNSRFESGLRSPLDEAVLALCDRYKRDDGGTVGALDANAKAVLRERCHALERQGRRVLGWAWPGATCARTIPTRWFPRVENPHEC